MNKKTTPTKAAAPAADNYLGQGIKGERKKSGLGTFLDRLPAPFISLNSVIAAVAEANEGSFREAARGLRILEREDDFPSWYRWADAKSKGKLDTEIGAAWGPKLLQHAEMFGEPVEFPHDYYRDCGYDLSAMPEGSVHHFLAVGPTLGFQRSDIGPFLTRHGIKGFELPPPRESNLDGGETGPDVPAVLEPANAQPRCLRTTDMAWCFAGLNGWDEDRWKKRLGDPPKWLETCREEQGSRGGRQNLWNPLLIGAALTGRNLVEWKSVRAKFQSNLQLKDWKSIWDEYERDNHEVD